MWASEYVKAATAQISDPAKAAEVTRELLTHLEEIKAEAIAAGVEADMAEAMALTRMGPAEALAGSLAETHHSPLPWRHYLAVVPVLGLLYWWQVAVNAIAFWRVAIGLILLLLFCLMPGGEVWRRFGRRLRADIRQKWAWVQRQPIGQAAKLALLGPVGVGLCLFVMIASLIRGPFGSSAVPILVLLSGLPLPIVGYLGQVRQGLSPYLVVTLGALEGLGLLFLWGLFGGGHRDFYLLVWGLYLPMGLLVTYLLQRWSKRQISVRVVVEKGAPN